jgi:hypothetical protein
MASPSPRSSEVAALKAQVRALERQVRKHDLQIAELHKQGAALPVVGWERPLARSRRVGDSVRTIERQVLAGILEKRVEGRKVYIRDKPIESAREVRRGRPPKSSAIAAPTVAITDRAGPQFPFVAQKEPP